MEFLDVLNSDLLFPTFALVVLIIFFVNRVRTRRKFKR